MRSRHVLLGVSDHIMINVRIIIIIIIIEGLSLLQSIPPTTANKQTQAQTRRGSRARKLLGAKAKNVRIEDLIIIAGPAIPTEARS